MRFAFTEDQDAFAEATRELFADRCGPDAVRRAWASDDGRLPDLWSQLVEMGVVGMLAPEASGGLGLGLVDLVRVLHEAGRAAVPSPLSVVAAVAVPALVESGDVGAAALAGVLDGSATVAVGLEPDTVVADAATAACLLLESDGVLHLVARDLVELESVESVDGARRLSRVAAGWLGEATPLGVTTRTSLDRLATARAAELCGLADRMVELTVDYVIERRQFGVPIGSFQAVKHHLSNALLAAEFAKPLVWRAALSLTEGDPDASVHASAAKAAASDAAVKVSELALQCHGAIGYTVEHDLHLFMKRAWALAATAGDARWHRRRIAVEWGLLPT